MRTQPPTVILLVMGLTLLVGVPVAVSSPAPATFGDAPAPSTTIPESVESSLAAPTVEPAADTAARDPLTSAPPANAASVRSARVADLPSEASPPGAVRLERLGIVAPTDPVGMSDRVMDVPDDVDRAGWFEPGVAPGAEQGSAVMSAHVDSRSQGEGAFLPLRHAELGDRIEVDTLEGETLAFEVTARAQYEKSELPSADLFRRDGPPQLVLITCGGTFNDQTGSYDDNVVVVAQPLEG